MFLRTYRINQKKEDRRLKFSFLYSLYWAVLKKDPTWHYFFDPEGITLRFSPKFEPKVKKWLSINCKEYELTYKRRLLYEPKRHEYYGVAFLGDYTIPLFHDMAVLMTIFPPNVSFHPMHERLNHGLMNMLGIHNFYVESKIYLDLAENRAKLGGFSLGLPKFLYKWWLWILSKWNLKKS